MERGIAVLWCPFRTFLICLVHNDINVLYMSCCYRKSIYLYRIFLLSLFKLIIFRTSLHSVYESYPITTMDCI